MGGLESSDAVAHALTGARVVKAFNHLPAALLGSEPHAERGRRVVFVSSNDPEASERVVQLAAMLGLRRSRSERSPKVALSFGGAGRSC
jgi:predicted dinucleotide-binding enzyme